MENRVSKTRFKSRALEYFRQVQSTGKELIITERGKPVLKITPFKTNSKDALADLRGSVLKYDRPLDPVALEDWEALR